MPGYGTFADQNRQQRTVDVLGSGCASGGPPLPPGRFVGERSPEALAYKITIWEASDRKHGFRVETPAIAGLHYSAWKELEAEWNAPRSRS